MRRKDPGQIFGANIFPLGSFEIRTNQRRRVVEMTERTDRLLAEHALFALVPLGDDVPYQALLRIDFDLLQAILAASLAFGPARTFFQAKSRLFEKSANRGFPGSDLDRGRFLRFRTSHQALAAIAKERTHAGNRAQDEKRGCQHEDSDDDSER